MATNFKIPKTVDPIAAGKMADKLQERTYSGSPEVKTSPEKLLQFKVPAEIHKEFKLHAASQELTMLELFKKMYAEYMSNHSNMKQ